MPDPLRFGRYETRDVLGEGSMGKVYRAFDPLGRRTVAVKTLHQAFRTGPQAAEYTRRFRREAQAAGALLHPNIVTVFDVGEDYFVMELLEGVTLEQLLSERGKLERQEALSILGRIAEALECGHAHGVIHRDLKPANVMVLPDGRAKLMDFGVAHLSARPITAAGKSLGSPSYMAPEQIEQGLATPRTDLFSFAVMSYELLTGHHPFAADHVMTTLHRVVNMEAASPRRYAPELPEAYDVVFARALDKRPERRHPGPMVFVEELGFSRHAADVVPAPRYAPHAHPISRASDTTATMLDAGRLAAPARRSARIRSFAALLALAVPLLWLRGARAPELATSGLLVRTLPPGARVEVDGMVRGVTPLDLTDLRPGLHRVRVVLADHVPAELRLSLAERMPPVPLHFDLVPDPQPPAPTPRAAAADAPRPPITLPAGVLPVRVAGDLPSYPERAEELRLEGTVTVDMVIDERGRPRDLWVRESAGKLLDRSVLEALANWRYEPTVRDGQAVPVRHRYRHHFRRG